MANFVETFTRLPDVDYLVAAIKRGAPKRGWYANSRRALQSLFGDDADVFTGVLAATSPQTSVESNLTNALNIFVNWKAAGRPTDADAQNLMRKASVAQTVDKHKWDTQAGFRDKLRDEAQAVALERSAKIVAGDSATSRVLEEALGRVAKEPNNLNHYRSVSQAYRQLGNLEEALAWVRKAREQPAGKGDAALDIVGVAGLEEAGPAHISFLSNRRYAALFRDSRAGAVLRCPPTGTLSRSIVAAAVFEIVEQLDAARTVDRLVEVADGPCGDGLGSADQLRELGRGVAHGPVVLTDRLTGEDGAPVRSPFPYVHHVSQDAQVGRLPALFASHPELYGDLVVGIKAFDPETQRTGASVVTAASGRSPTTERALSGTTEPSPRWSTS